MASDVAPVGGMERVAFELCSRLLDRGWQITVIARSCGVPAQPGLRFVRILAPSRPVSVALVASLLTGTLAVLRHRRGLVHTTNPVVANRVEVINAQFCDRAYRARVGVQRSSRRSPLYRLSAWVTARVELLSEAWCYRPGRAQLIACASAGLADEVREFYPEVKPTVRVAPNGVDCQAFREAQSRRAETRAQLGVTDDELLGIFVGGDWHRKGLAYAIEAVAASPGWKLAVLGTGDREGFSRLAHDRLAGERVVFQGEVADPRPYYVASDALLFPSHYEAFSLVTLEAAAAGLPLLVPPINGTEELVEDGLNGWLIERDGAAIARRLAQLRAEPARHESMRQAARRSAERYDWERVVDRFESLYAELNGSRS